MERPCPGSSELLLAEREKTKDGKTGRGCGKLPLWQAASRAARLLGGLALLWWTCPQGLKVSPEGKDRACDLSKPILSRTFSLCCPISWSVYPHSFHTGVPPTHPNTLLPVTSQTPRTSTQVHLHYLPPAKPLQAMAHRSPLHSTHLSSPTSLLGTLGRQSEHPGISWH